MSPDLMFWVGVAIKMAITALSVLVATITAEKLGAAVGACQSFGNQLFGVEFGSRSHEPRFRFVGHRFKWAVFVAEALQSIGVQIQKSLRPKNSPLNHVNEFLEIYCFIF